MENIPSEGSMTIIGGLQAHQVPRIDGICPALTSAMGMGGGNTPCISSKIVKAVITPDRENKRQNGRRMKDAGEPMFTLTSQDRHGVAIQFTRKGDPKEVDVANTLVAATPKRALGNNSPITGVAILKKERNEYGKEIRKSYESGEVKEQRKNMTQYTPRQDGIANTLSTVEKDNYLLVNEHKLGGVQVIGNYSPSGHNASRVITPQGIAPTVMENHGTVTAVVINDETKQ